MLIGEYRHSLDPKGRVNFPAKLREDLGDSFIICKGLDNCLYVYRMSEWDKLVEKTSALPSSKARTIQRFFFASAVCCEPDKQGRVLIPQTPLGRAVIGNRHPEQAVKQVADVPVIIVTPVITGVFHQIFALQIRIFRQRLV